MKKVFLLLAILPFLFSCAGFTKMGNLTMVSTRNVDSSVEYKPLKTYVTARGTSQRGEALQVAIDNAVKSVPGGEFMKNVKISVSQNGQIVRVEGDVWGVPPLNVNVTTGVSADNTLNVGDKVAYNFFGFKEGTITGINNNKALVKCADGKIRSFAFKALTKVTTQ
jgi:hypothetical protein